MAAEGGLNVFFGSRAVVLSELSTREKEKYYNLLLESDVRFYVDEDQPDVYVSNLRLLAPGVKKEKTKGGALQSDKPATPIKERLQRLNETGHVSVDASFDYAPYKKFVAIIAHERDICKPKARILSWLMKTIEELYDQRFQYEKSDVERDNATSAAPSGSHLDATSEAQLYLQIFPVFIYKRLSTVLGLRFIVEQNCWDLLYNVDRLRSDYLEVEIFGRFLAEFYNHDDLLFFLYVRSVLASVLHINFRGRWSKLDGPGRQTPQALWLSYRECTQVARIVFGGKNESLCKEFFTLMTHQIVGKKTEQGDSRRIDITQFLHLSLAFYHQTQSGAISSVCIQLKAEREKEFLDHICEILYALIESGALASEADAEAILLQMIETMRLKVNALIGQPDFSSVDAYDAQLLNALRNPSLKAEMEQYRDSLIATRRVTR